jgi:hypothetical protein
MLVRRDQPIGMRHFPPDRPDPPANQRGTAEQACCGFRVTVISAPEGYNWV